MALSSYLLLCLFATVAVIQAGLVPSPASPILCAPLDNRPKITREDCGKALRKFTSESNVVFWSGKGHYHSCGTCRVAITKPSLPNTTHHAAVFSDVLVALHRGYDQCQGTPTNSTIGNYQSVSVLLDVGNGEQCSD
ncbi:hypothetical protein PCANC_08182 [Puccinia coronata f. sp. avenae]|uniref:Ecp2 effector protein domain-containing protein n=1 Tax=Puccinia coronata f. sp. avenae TaxID=200324 RepID=A0A2N5VJ81_9BASI|nr:hypothetical protein PCANC_08182 [Puccinia coronata f. sp. avenae]